MKTLTVKLYSYTELSAEAQKRVIQDRIKSAENDPYLLEFQTDEMAASLRYVAEAGGLTLTDWSFGACCQGHKATVRGRAADLSGWRALGWFAKVLIDAGHERPAHFAEMTFPGVCGFTGVCYDDDIAEAVWGALLAGETVARAFDRAAGAMCQYCERELEYLTSEGAVMETLDETAEKYTETGEKY